MLCLVTKTTAKCSTVELKSFCCVFSATSWLWWNCYMLHSTQHTHKQSSNIYHMTADQCTGVSFSYKTVTDYSSTSGDAILCHRDLSSLLPVSPILLFLWEMWNRGGVFVQVYVTDGTVTYLGWYGVSPHNCCLHLHIFERQNILLTPFICMLRAPNCVYGSMVPTEPLSRLPPLPMGSGVQVMGERLLQLLLTKPPCAPQLYQLSFLSCFCWWCFGFCCSSLPICLCCCWSLQRCHRREDCLQAFILGVSCLLFFPP